MSILTRIIDAAIPPPTEPLEEWRFDSRFRRCLSKVKCKARTHKRTLWIRPENVDKFKELIDKNGLANDERSQEAVKWLRENPAEMLRYIH